MAIIEGIVDIRTLEVLFSVFLPPDGARQSSYEGGQEGCRELGRELRSPYEYLDVRAAANGMSPKFEDDFFSPFRNSSFLKLTFSFENIFRSGTF